MPASVRGLVAGLFIFVAGPPLGAMLLTVPLLLAAAVNMLAGIEGPVKASDVAALFIAFPLLMAFGSYVLAGLAALIAGTLLGLVTRLRGRFNMWEATLAVLIGLGVGLLFAARPICSGAGPSCSAGNFLALMLLLSVIGVLAAKACRTLLRSLRVLPR
jgi:hypothetical protein